MPMLILRPLTALAVAVQAKAHMFNWIRSAPSSFGKKLVFACLLCTGAGLTGAQTLVSAPSAQSFGQVEVNSVAPAAQVLTYISAGGITPAFSLAYGTDYTLGLPKCTGSGSVSCIISVGFQPHWPGLRQDALLAKDRLGNVIATTLVYGTGLGPQLALYQGIAIDNAGNLFIADSLNQVVRKVNAASGVISTIAGTWTPGYTGDGGPASRATLNNPLAIALDGSGNLYIADQGNNVIRKVSAANGQITTVAGGGAGASGPDGLGDGGLATNALLAGPNDVALDGAGNLFIADSFDGMIRRVDAASAIITVVAVPGVRNPMGVAVDARGNIFIADNGNSMVRRVDASTGATSVVAGTGASGFSGDLGPAVSARLGSPVCVRVDAAGNLYIADQGKNVIRQVNAQSGMINTIAGTGAPGYAGNGGIPTGAGLKNPTGLALDSAGNIYIADYANNVIRKISQVSGIGFPSTLVGEASPPQMLTVLNIGNQAVSFTGLTISSNFSQAIVGGINCSTSITLAAAASCVIALDFAPAAGGNLSGSLVLTDNSFNQAGTSQSIALTGTGAMGAIPQLSLTPSSLTFAAQAIGTSSSAQSITLTNSGAAALNFSSIQLGGVNSADFSMTQSCPIVLAAKATCSLSVVFSPLAAGPRSASLIFIDNLANSPQAVNITGTGGLPAIADATATQYYAGVDSHVHELYVQGGAWHDYDLTAATGGPNVAAGATIASVMDTISNLLRVNYAGVDSHVHELYLYGGVWHDYDLTAAAGGPNIAARVSIANIVDTIANMLRIDYVSADAHAHELYIASGAWHDLDLTSAAGGPNIAPGASIANVVDTISKLFRINYPGIDSHIHELYFWAGAWHDYDLTGAAGGPKVAAGVSIANVVDTVSNLLRINYAAIDSHVHELYPYAGAWHDYDLTAAAGGPKVATGVSIANVVDTISNLLRINYAGADSHVHELYPYAGAWHDYDLTAAAGGLNASAGASIANVADTISNLLRINYAGADSHVHELYPYAGAWHDYDLTAAADGPSGEIRR